MIQYGRINKFTKNTLPLFINKKKQFLNKTKMNLDESLSKELFGEKKTIEIYTNPGKIKIKESDIIEREKKLKSLAEVWKRERMVQEESSRQLFGFTKNSEVLNGRLAMFFLTTGLLTEIWTKQTIIGQIDTMLRIIGIV
jgi:hypothetical protein